MGVVFQDNRLFPHLSVRGNLQVGLKQTPRSERRFDVDAVARWLQIDSLLDRRVTQLSGGQQRRAAIARAVLMSPRLLLLDEPTTGLDHQLRDRLFPMLREVQLRTAIPIVVVSHRLPDLLRMTDHLLLVDEGRAEIGGAYEQLLRDPRAVHRLDLQEPINVLRLRVDGHDPDRGQTLLRPLEANQRTIPIRAALTPDLETGAVTSAMLRPSDIALAMAPVETISMQNQLDGRIERIDDCDGHVLCLVDIGAAVLVEVTRQAATDLELRPGKQVRVLFKSSAIRLAACGETAPQPSDDALSPSTVSPRHAGATLVRP